MAARVESIAKSGLQAIPAQYVRPLNERPTNLALDLKEADHGNPQSGPQIPVIDFFALEISKDSREKTMQDISKACEEWGVMQIINHGIPETLIASLKDAGQEFFALPVQQKEVYANNAAAGILDGYGSKLAANASGQLEWEDYFFHLLWPDHKRDISRWPKQPGNYREVTEEYGKEVRKLASKVLGILSLQLGLEETLLEKILGGDDLEMQMKINYYPICPQPELALGVEAHTDISALTILLHNMVPGLQICKDGHWVTARCIPGALIVHIGDQIEILSNGRYKSGLHRGLVNKEKVRLSWAVFCNPPQDAVIGPLKELVDSNNSPLFEAKSYKQHMDHKLFRKGR